MGRSFRGHGGGGGASGHPLKHVSALRCAAGRPRHSRGRQSCWSGGGHRCSHILRYGASRCRRCGGAPSKGLQRGSGLVLCRGAGVGSLSFRRNIPRNPPPLFLFPRESPPSSLCSDTVLAAEGEVRPSGSSVTLPPGEGGTSTTIPVPIMRVFVRASWRACTWLGTDEVEAVTAGAEAARVSAGCLTGSGASAGGSSSLA